MTKILENNLNLKEAIEISLDSRYHFSNNPRKNISYYNLIELNLSEIDFYNYKYNYFKLTIDLKLYKLDTSNLSLIDYEILFDFENNKFHLRLMNQNDTIIYDEKANDLDIYNIMLDIKPIKNKEEEFYSILDIGYNNKLFKDTIDKILEKYPKKIEFFKNIENLNPKFNSLKKSDEYGLFEHRIMNFKKYIKQNKFHG